MIRNGRLLATLLLFCSAAALLAPASGCKKAPESAFGSKVTRRQIRIGMIAKSESNSVFAAAHLGADEAARELSDNYGIDVQVIWRTPADEDAAKQAEAIRQLTDEHVDGIMISCSDAKVLTGAINQAVEKGVIVVCFDSDAPDSKRLCNYGTDDMQLGHLIMSQLAQQMGNKGTVAILAGHPTAPNLKLRVKAIREELANHPNMHELNDGNGVFYNEESPDLAYDAVKQAMAANPGKIDGWAMAGGWPLFQSKPLPWDPPGSVKAVACDALPKQLMFLRTGYAQALVAQDCYGWGHRPVEIIVEKILSGKDPTDMDPVTHKIPTPLQIVTAGSLDGYVQTAGKQFNH